jgi:hypothetical protein
VDRRDSAASVSADSRLADAGARLDRLAAGHPLA